MSALSEKVQKEVRVVMEDKAAYITRGDCKDFTDYRARTAELVGMHNAIQLFLDVENQHNPEDWNEDI